jgi:hypothetical protein
MKLWQPGAVQSASRLIVEQVLLAQTGSSSAPHFPRFSRFSRFSRSSSSSSAQRFSRTTGTDAAAISNSTEIAEERKYLLIIKEYISIFFYFS